MGQVVSEFLPHTCCQAQKCSCCLVIFHKMRQKTTMALLICLIKQISSMMGGAPAREDPLDPLSNFIKELQDPSSMSCPDISARS